MCECRHRYASDRGLRAYTRDVAPIEGRVRVRVEMDERRCGEEEAREDKAHRHSAAHLPSLLNRKQARSSVGASKPLNSSP